MNPGDIKAAGFPGRTLPAALLFSALCLLAGAVLPAYAAFGDLGAGARGPGLGNAMAAVADDVYALHYNPAGLGLVARPQFAAAYTQHYMGLTDGSNMGTSFFGYAHPLENGRRGTFAGALNSFTLDGGLYRENTIYLSYGRLAWTRPGGAELFMGTTLKYLHSSFGYSAESADATNGIIRTGQADPLLSGNSSHKAFDADLGLLYRLNTHYQLGLQAAHITRPEMAFSSADSDRLPVAVKLGFNYKSLISNLAAQVETKTAPDGSADNIVTAAAERWFPKAMTGDFGVRGAMGIGTREYKQLSLGLSYRTRRVQVDYGFALPFGGISGTSGSHRMALTFHFGRPTEDEETLAMLMETMRRLKADPAEIATSPTAAILARSEEAVKAGRYREAVRLASEVTDIDPEAAAAWENMGLAYLGLKKYKSSIYAWEKAYQHEKRHRLRKTIKGHIQFIMKIERSAARIKPAPAPAPVTPAPQRPTLSPQQIDDLLNRAVDYYVKQEFDKARELFETVLKDDPANVEASKALRRLNDEKGF